MTDSETTGLIIAGLVLFLYFWQVWSYGSRR